MRKCNFTIERLTLERWLVTRGWSDDGFEGVSRIWSKGNVIGIKTTQAANFQICADVTEYMQKYHPELLPQLEEEAPKFP